ncbi:MAG: hypothetical protein ACK5C0_12410 [Candidatus Kapaibacterium sp.]
MAHNYAVEYYNVSLFGQITLLWRILLGMSRGKSFSSIFFTFFGQKFA